jgi:heptosyltransferase-1
MHLAAALRVPVVAIFGPTDPTRNGPYGTEAVALRSPQSVTNHSRRAPADPAMLAILPETVLAAALQLLNSSPPPPGLPGTQVETALKGIELP